MKDISNSSSSSPISSLRQISEPENAREDENDVIQNELQDHSDLCSDSTVLKRFKRHMIDIQKIILNKQ